MSVEQAKKLITEAQTKNEELVLKLRDAQDLSDVIESNLEAALEELEGEDPDEGEIEENDEYHGGPAGSDGRKVIANQTFNSPLDLKENTDYFECVIKKAFGGGNPCPDRIRFLSCTFKDIQGVSPSGGSSKIIYFNNGKNEDEVDLIFDDCIIDGCTADEFIEGKLSKVTFANCVQKNSKLKRTIKQRHGKKLTVVNCEGFGEIAARGWAHFIDDCPSATVIFWAGTLPAKFKDWKDMHVPDGGNNLQATEASYANGVKKLIIGKKANDSDHPYPCLDCIGGPDIDTIEEAGPVKDFTREAINSPEELWERVGA